VAPNFPALAANAKLADVALIVGNLHNGKGAMPAFPDLTPEQIAALATYVRNSWGNSFGGVSPQEVSDLLAALPQAGGEQVSVWDGVFTQAQSDRGKIFYSGICAKCHGRSGNGAGDPDQPESPSVARQAFLTKWQGRNLAALFEYVRTTMPVDNPNSRSDQEYIDAIAYMLTLSQAPAGDTELPPDPAALGKFIIGPKPAE
jgi:mono/diheme cytochrome c family protein